MKLVFQYPGQEKISDFYYPTENPGENHIKNPTWFLPEVGFHQIQVKKLRVRVGFLIFFPSESQLVVIYLQASDVHQYGGQLK